MNNFTASHHYALHVTFIDFRSDNRMLQKRLTKIMGSFRMARCGGGEKCTSPWQSEQTAGWKLKMKWLVNFLTNKLWIIQCSSTFGVCGWNPMLPPLTVWRFYPRKKSYSDTTQMKPLKQYLKKILPTTRQACQKCAGNRRYRRQLWGFCRL